MPNRRNKPRQRGDVRNLSMEDAAAAIYGGHELGDQGIIRPVTMDEITRDPRTQVRVDGLDRERVRRYVDFRIAGGQYDDPIILYRDGDRLILAAGWHRCEAESEVNAIVERAAAADETIELAPFLAEIREDGGLEAAIECAEDDNLKHGLELSTKDKRHILAQRLARGHEWAQLSTRTLAGFLGVSHMTVSKWRQAIEAESPVNKFTPDQRVGADGKLYDTSGITDANRRRADDQASAPAASPQHDQPGGIDPESYTYGDDPDAGGDWLDETVTWPGTAPEPTAADRALTAEQRAIEQAIRHALSAVDELGWLELSDAAAARLGRDVDGNELSDVLSRMMDDGALINDGAIFRLPEALVPPPAADLASDHDDPDAGGDWLDETVTRPGTAPEPAADDAVFPQALQTEIRLRNSAYDVRDAISRLVVQQDLTGLSELRPDRLAGLDSDLEHLQYMANVLLAYLDELRQWTSGQDLTPQGR